MIRSSACQPWRADHPGPCRRTRRPSRHLHHSLGHDRYERFAAYDQAWNDWFEMQGIEPFRIAYEALSADPLGSLRKVLSRLGLKCEGASGITPGVGKLADATNHEWAMRFRLEHNIA
ncbi:Stf0 family sulfotransferase [Sinorhizobium meliloti]|uniref:Stf0 family sulfotransferase n=1 Tax=Rhizobium meliloti TaxID=382 RepID=UPI0030CBDC68